MALQRTRALAFARVRSLPSVARRSPLNAQPLARRELAWLLLVPALFLAHSAQGEDWPGNPPPGAKPPLLLHRVEAAQRPLAEPVKATGVLILEFVVEADGTVGPVRVAQSTHPVVDAAWVRAVRKWRYRAGTLKGKPIRWPATVTITAHPETWPRKKAANGPAG